MKKIKIFFLFTILSCSNFAHTTLFEILSVLGACYTFVHNNPTARQHLFTETGNVNLLGVYGCYHGFKRWATHCWIKADTFLGKKAPNWWRSEENIQREEQERQQAQREEQIRSDEQKKILEQQNEQLKKELSEQQSKNSFLENMYHQNNIQTAVSAANKKRDEEIARLKEQIDHINTNKIESTLKKQLDNYKKELDKYQRAFCALYYILMIQTSNTQYSLPTTNTCYNNNKFSTASTNIPVWSNIMQHNSVAPNNSNHNNQFLHPTNLPRQQAHNTLPNNLD